MEINSNHSTYGAAFRQKPIFFMSGKETVAFFEGKLKKNMTLQEDSCTLGSNDTYRRQHTTYEVSDKKKGSTFLDLDFLIKDETSSLKGNLSDKKDVDFYNFSIPFNRTIQNYFGVQIYMDMPEGCDYDLTLYDEYGNQVGKAEWDGEGRKTLTIPNWDTNTNKYCIKIENKNGEEVSPDDYYKISFKVSENKEQEKTDAIRAAFGNLHGAYSRKDENWREYLDKYNEVLMDTEKNYTKEMEKLHQKQFESLPEEKQYKGGRTVDELLQDMAEGNVQVIADFLRRRSAQPARDLRAFASLILFNYLIGNCDNHLKNLSILYAPDWQSFILAPAYDLVSTTYFARFSREMGMAIGEHTDIEEVTTADFAILADQLGISMRVLRNIVDTFAEKALPSLREEGTQLASEGYDAAPYIADDIEEDIAPRLEILSSL